MLDASAQPAEATAAPKRHGRSLDPVLMMLAAMVVAIAMTWAIPSGIHQRVSDKENAPVIAGTYSRLPKSPSLADLAPHGTTPGIARPVSPFALATTIPEGLLKTAPLVVMVLMLGGMFGVLRASGALDAGIKRLVGVTRGNIALLVPALMLAFSAGSTFLGMVTEYLLLIPIMIVLAKDLGRPPMFGFAIIALAAKVGYLSSVTNPFALLIAQPIAGVPVFSALELRLGIWVVYLLVAIGVVLRFGRHAEGVPVTDSEPLTGRHISILLVAGTMLGALVYGSIALGWDDKAFGAVFVIAAILIATIAGMGAAQAAHLFVRGMEAMVLAALLVGMGRSVEIILRQGQILDTIIEALSGEIGGLGPYLVAPILMGVEMVLTLLIPSTSAKAALSIPILAPVAATCGVSGQITVLAFLLGNGLINMMAPTSGMLLAYLAAAGIPYSQWFRFVAPLFLFFTILSVAALMLAVALGY